MFPKLKKSEKDIYLDHAATTYLVPAVKKAMAPFLAEKFGNPFALYQKGMEAKLAIDASRKTIADIINAKASEIIFTAGGTESVNLAIFGVARRHKTSASFITSAIEHHCVINSFNALKQEGRETTFIGVDGRGFINLDGLKKSVRPETVFVSVMLANNEIGAIEPVAEIGKWLKHLNAQRLSQGLPKIFFHTDACQAAGFMDLNVEKLGVDLMSVNGSKIYGPKQTGFLYLRSGTEIKPLIYGGGQESGLRSGTQNVAGTVGLSKAFELVQKNKDAENIRLNELACYLINKIKQKVPDVLLNGPDNTELKSKAGNLRLPNNINFTIKNVEGEALMLYLDAYGISCSTASACSTGSLDPSHVLLAIGRTSQEAQSSIRFSLGKASTKADLDYLVKILPQIVKELRETK